MSDAMNRRRFLGNAAMSSAVAGLALGGSHARANAAPGDTVVVGVMGLSRGSALAASFARHEGVVVKYVCDVDATRAGACAEKVGDIAGQAPEAIGDFRQMLDDKSVDAIVNATPNHWHAPGTILACTAGKHVYVEKPCSHNPREGELMIEAARKNGCAVQLGTQRRSGPTMREAMQRLREGVIGRVYLARAWYNSARGPIGVGKPASVPSNLNYDLWQGPAPRRPYLDNRVPYNWHWFWHWGNGELGNNGVHTLDLCRWGIGGDFPIRVTSSGGRYHFEDDQETPDTQTVCFEFEGKCAVTWQGLSCNRHRLGFVVYYGDGGALELDSNGSYVIFDGRDKEVKRQAATTRGDQEHIANFLAAIRKDTPLELNAEIAQGHRSTLLCHLGNIAHRTGHSLDCDPTNGHILDAPEAMKLWSREYEPGWEPKV
ncbi:MAG: Gfo/Idh/MocA family protein [Pirellulaceae bacterium]